MERVSASYRVRVRRSLLMMMMQLMMMMLFTATGLGKEGRSLLVRPQTRQLPTIRCYQHRSISSSLKAHQYSELRADIYSTAKRINKVIVEAFAPEKMSGSEVQRLKAFLEEHVSELNQVNVVTLMHRCSKKRMRVFELCSAEMVLGAFDVRSPTGGVLSPQGISNAVYSLQHTADGHPLEQQLIGRLAEQLLSSTGRFDSQALSNVFYGLKMFSWTSPASQSLLLALQYNIMRNHLQVSDTEHSVHRAFLNYLRSEIDDLLGAVGGGSDEGMCSTMDQSHHWFEADRSLIDGFAMRAAVRMTPQGIGSAFLGLQGLGQWTQLNNNNSSSSSGSCEHFRSVDGAVRFMVLFLSQTLSNSHDASMPLDAQALANILLGLKGFRCDRDEALLAVREAARRIELDGTHRVFSSMRGRELSMSVWSMQWMASDEPALHSLLSCFNGGLDHLLITHTPTGGKGGRSSQGIRFQTAEELGMCFGGMRRMHSTNKEVRRLLQHVTSMIPPSWMDDDDDLPSEPALDSSRAELSISAHQLSSAVYGLRNMCDDCSEVRRAVSSLSGLLIQQQQQRRRKRGSGAVRFNGQAIATAVYGLQSMSANSAEVRTLLQVLLDNWDASADDFNAQHIAMVGYGLRSLRLPPAVTATVSGRDPLPPLLVEFSKAIASSKHPLSLGTIASVMYGLQGISSDAHGVRAVVAELSAKLLLLLRGSSEEAFDPTGQEIAMMGYGMQSMGSQWHRVQLMVELFAEVLDRSTAPLSGAELSQVFYGLKSMGGGKPFERSSGTLQRAQQEHMHWDTDHGTALKRRFRLPRALLKLLLALERKLLSRRERLTASMVASAVFGLQGISSDVPTVRRILAVLSDDLLQSSDPLDGKGIGSALFGMQNMTSKSPQVRELLRCLSEVIDRSNATLNAQATGNAFYGLQGMSSDAHETRQLLLSLTKKMRAAPVRDRRQSDHVLTGQNIGNALWGLRNMSIPDLQETADETATTAAFREGSCSVQLAVGEVVQDEVVLAVEALTERIAESSAQMSGQNIGNAFYALHGMSSTHPAVRRLLAALALKLVASTGELSGLDVGMTLYGLRRMDSTLPEVRVVLGALLHKIRSSPVELQLRDLSMAIVGTLSVTPWVRDDYLRVLSSKLPGMRYLGDDELEPDDDDDDK